MDNVGTRRQVAFLVFDQLSILSSSPGGTNANAGTFVLYAAHKKQSKCPHIVSTSFLESSSLKRSENSFSTSTTITSKPSGDISVAPMKVDHKNGGKSMKGRLDMLLGFAVGISSACTSSFDLTSFTDSIFGTSIVKSSKRLSMSNDIGIAFDELKPLRDTSCDSGNKLLFPRSITLWESAMDFVALE